MRNSIIRKRADADLARAAVLAGLGAAGGWATNKFILRNKSTKSQVMAAAIGGLLGGGGSLTYDLLTSKRKAPYGLGRFKEEADRLRAEGKHPMTEAAKNAVGNTAIAAATGSMVDEAGRRVAHLTGDLTVPDSLYGIEINRGDGLLAKLGITRPRISRKSWDAATTENKIKAMNEIMNGRVDVNVTGDIKDSFNNIMRGSNNTANEIAKVDQGINSLTGQIKSLQARVLHERDRQNAASMQITLDDLLEKRTEAMGRKNALLAMGEFGSKGNKSTLWDNLKDMWRTKSIDPRMFKRGKRIGGKLGALVGLGLTGVDVVDKGITWSQYDN